MPDLFCTMLKLDNANVQCTRYSTRFLFVCFFFNKNRHETGHYWWFLRSDRWFLSVSTTPDAFQTSELRKRPTFDEGYFFIFHRNFPKSIIDSKGVLSNTSKAVRTDFSIAKSVFSNSGEVSSIQKLIKNSSWTQAASENSFGECLR